MPSPATRGRRVSILIAAVCGTAVAACLGVWQLSRAEQKLALRDAIEHRSHEPQVAFADLPTGREAAEKLHYRPISVHGRWLAARTIYLDNRQMNGNPGFYVVTPLELAPNDAVLVQRGWVPRNINDRNVVPPVVTPAGDVVVNGRIAPPPSRLFEFAADANGVIRQNLDIDRYAAEIGIGLRPWSVQQLDEGAAAGDGLLRHWPQPAVDVSRNHGYAFQWFALSALIAGLYVRYQVVRPRRLAG